MRLTRKLALLSVIATLAGCHRRYVVPESPMPPNTILLSQMMRQLTTAHPGLTGQLIAQIQSSGKKGPALLTPALIDELRKRILGNDWQGLDRFPGWSMREINPTVRVAGHLAGKSAEAESLAARHPGAPPTETQTRAYLDLGPYALDKGETVSLDEPSTLPPFNPEGLVTPLGAGVVRGDGPNALAPEHAEAQRLADVLNRLAANALDGVKPFMVTVHDHEATTPQQLISALATVGYTVTVNDARYFANFGHFHYQGKDVMMPFWIDTGLIIPKSHGRHLLVPAAHAEYEWHIHSAAGAPGPAFNADVSYYFGIDGKSQWRTMDTLDQPWVLKRNAHAYTGAQAVEVTRLASLLTIAYLHLHATRPQLPFGGYYALGVCQDGVSAIERKLTGLVTLFPNTADAALFDDTRDAEVNAMMTDIPKDREGIAPEPARIFGSLPAAPGPSPNHAFDAITIPGLADDLNRTYASWQNGDFDRAHHRFLYPALLIGCAIAAAAWFVRHRRRELA